MRFLPRRRSHRAAAGFAAALVIAAAWHVAAAQEATKNFVVHEAPKEIRAISFQDDRGQTRGLADFKGKVVLLNIWATWCVPCRGEMPAFDRLQVALGGPEFEVVPLSVDRGGIETIRKFYAEIGIRNLATYVDSSGKAMRELGLVGLPTTLLIDRTGREMARLIGPAEWDSPKIAEFLRCVISGGAAKSQSDSNAAATALCRRQP